MTHPETLPDTPDQENNGKNIPDANVEREIETAAKKAKTVGDLRKNVSTRIDELQKAQGQSVNAKTGEGLPPPSAAPQADIVGKLQQEEQKMATDMKEFDGVALADDLPPGVLGSIDKVGGSQSQARVSKNLVKNRTEMKRTLIHETHADVGHSSQVELKDVKNQDAALIVNGEKKSVTTVYEGDVERGTAIVMGEGAQTHREDQPEEEYADGQRTANHVIGKVGEETWNNALKETGNIGEVQKALWEKQLEASSSNREKTVSRIMEEARTTGHTRQAMEVLMAA